MYLVTLWSECKVWSENTHVFPGATEQERTLINERFKSVCICKCKMMSFTQTAKIHLSHIHQLFSLCFLHTHVRVHVRPYRNLTVRSDFLLAARPWFSITSPFPCPGPGAKQSTTCIKHPWTEPTKRGYYGTSIMASRLFSSRLKFGRTTSLAAEQHVICEPVWKHVADLSELLFLNRRQLF